jgi:hypothetical protein
VSEARVADIVTNRDLYLAVLQLSEQHCGNARSLEDYLQALQRLPFAHGYFRRGAVTPDELLALLAEAFVAAPGRVPDGYIQTNAADICEDDRTDPPGLAGWEVRVTRQIIDLREMAANGQLANEQRFFGIDAPRGERWYNFTPCDFLECAARYSFVDGVEDESAPVGAISWEQFRDFLGAGQAYE